MAWYTTRIIDKDNDTEIRHSARSLASSINGSVSQLNLSSRSYDYSRNSLRYINSAAYIENSDPARDVLSRDSEYLKLQESRSDIVPPLDIKSEENYPITRDYTFSYRKYDEAPNTVLKPDKAYETWLSAKRKLISDEVARRKKAEEAKQKEIEERKRLAAEKYQKWLEKKVHSSGSQQSISSVVSKAETNMLSKSRSNIPPEEARIRLKEWERAKCLEDERRRMLKRQEEQRRLELEKQRRQMAAEAWAKWIANADKKPKPVPLNRGIFTLRGTVSDIFVNPNEWKPIVPVDQTK